MRKFLLSIFASSLLAVNLMAQNQRVSGTVTSDEGAAIAGVTVVVKGTNIGTVTNATGKYSINAAKDAVLRFTFVGMQEQEVAVAGQSVVNVKMISDATDIEDVVVTAFGTTKRKDLTGSVATVSADQISKQQVTSVTKALEGTVAGIQVTASSNQPGKDAKISIRGIGSLYSGTSALIVLDGTPYNGSLSDINPADIESMSISKDATSNSLYGSRAANGVVFVTTKKGLRNAPRITIGSRVGINSRAVSEYDIIKSPGEYFEIQWRGLRDSKWVENGGDLSAAGLYASQELLGQHGNYNPFSFSSQYLIDPTTGKLDKSAKQLYTDRLQDELFQNSMRQEHNFSISGGDDKSDYYLSLGYLQDDSYVLESGFERYNVRLNVNSQLKKWIKVGGNLAYARANQNSILESSKAANGAFNTALTWEPVYPVFARDSNGKIKRDENGKKIYDLGTGQTDGTTLRPGTMNNNIIASLQEDVRDIKRNNMSGRGYVNIYFLKNFTFSLNASVDYESAAERTFYNPKYGDGITPKGRIYKYNTDDYTTNLNQILSYQTSICDKHNITVLAGHEYYKYSYDYAYMHKTNIFNPSNSHLNNAGEMQEIDGYVQDHRIEGYFGKAEYNYNSKYYFSGSVRSDGTSRFKNDPWGTFWAVGASWRITQESFMESTSGWLNELKLRASYGTQGNEAVLNSNGTQQYYPYTDQYKVTISEGVLGTEITYYGNPTLTWEKQNTFDVGVDMRLFNRVSLTVDYFDRLSDGLIFKRSQDISSGRPYNWENVGKMRNSGVEFDLKVDILNKGDFRWDVSLNGYHYKNKMISLPAEYKEAGMPMASQRIFEGKDIYRWELLQYAGIDPQTGKSLWYMDKKEEDGKITKVTTNDQTKAKKYLLDKTALPTFNGGLSTNFRWKNIDFSVITSFQIGGYGYDYDYAQLNSSNFPMNRLKEYWKSWDPANPKANALPIMDSNDAGVSAASDRFLISKSYFNLRNVTLGYTFPSVWMKKIGIESIRLYAACDNVAFASKRKGYDPRQSIGGQSISDTQNGTYYSPIRTTSLGLNINF